MIRTATIYDSPGITSIYNHYIEHSISTFQEKRIEPSFIEEKISNTPAHCPWLVYEENNEVLGYAYASPWKAREAYRHSVEISVYTHPDYNGKGMGSQLYEELIRRLRSFNIHAVIGGISLPNAASVALHEKFGFEKVAHFKEVGYKFEQWIDVGYWELVLDA